jgi:hypothetical protein
MQRPGSTLSIPNVSAAPELFSKCRAATPLTSDCRRNDAFRTRRSLTRGTPRGLFGSIGLSQSRLGGIEIPQRSNGLPCRDVLSLFGGAQRFAASQLG